MISRIDMVQYIISLLDSGYFNRILKRQYRHFFNSDEITIFDVGGHRGESIGFFRKMFPNSFIHTFEPCPKNFARLFQKYGKLEKVFCNHFALGSTQETKKLHQNIMSSTTTLKEVDLSHAWSLKKSHVLGIRPSSLVVDSVDVLVTTLDEYVQENQINRIQILKIDTEGYELEVLRGAMHTLQQGRIDSIQLEFHDNPVYKDHYSRLDLEEFLQRHQYNLTKEIHHPLFQRSEMIFTRER